MDLPVKGNISSPEFSYRKLIFKTLTNLLVNVAMSPISFMANSLGLSPDKLEAIPLDACQWDFTSEQYTTLNDLVTILKSKPEMPLVLEQEINLSQAKEELAMYNARKRYYLSLHPEKTDSTLVAIDYAKINEIDAKDPAFNTYLTSLVEASYQNSSTSQKALTLVPEEKLQEQTTRFITLRNRKALSYLTSQGVPETNLRIETMKPELLNTYTGKKQYKINLVLAGDEQTPQE